MSSLKPASRPPATGVPAAPMFLLAAGLLLVIPSGFSGNPARALAGVQAAAPDSPPSTIAGHNDNNPQSFNQTKTLAQPVNATATTELLMNLVKNSFQSKSSSASNSNNHKPPAPHKLPLLPSLDHYRQQDSQTAYACEGNQLELGCPEGKLLRVLRAVYGRFSVSICNELGHSNLSVLCHSFGAFIIIQRTCNKRANCSVPVSPEVFGDPCEGTSKYLEVQYSCEDEGAREEVARHHRVGAQPPVVVSGGEPPAPPAHLATVADPLNNRLPPATPAHHQHHHHHQQHSSRPTDDKQVGGISNVIHQPASAGRAPTDLQPAPLPPLTGVAGLEAFCGPRISARNLAWNYTRLGERARQPCPDGSLGYASWLCDAERAAFVPSWTADFGQCKSRWLQSLSQQLDQVLESASKQQQPSGEQVRATAHKLVREILNEMSLMAHTRQLFSEDLKQIDLMTRQIIEQLRSYASLAVGALPTDELLAKVASLVSSVFDVSQRSAWLELQSPEMRRRLEQRYLGHLKEAGLMASLSAAPQAPAAHRHGNVFAGIVVISPPPRHLKAAAADDFEANQLLRQAQQSLNRFVTDASEQMEINELKIPLSVLRELASNGMNRFLVLDVKKPDYGLMRQQLEAAYESPAPTAVSDQFGGAADAQWASRAFGVFALNEAGDVLDGEQSPNSQPAGHRIAEVLGQWPISVDFRLAPAGAQPGALRQCTSLTSDSFAPNRCQTVRSNLTSHLCRCDQFGFVGLATSANQLLVPIDSLAASNTNYNWPAGAQPPLLAEPPYDDLLSRGAAASSSLGADRYIGAPSPTGKQQPGQEPALGLWFTVFVTFGLSLFVLTVVGFLMNAFLRTLNQRNLRKKHGPLAGGIFGGPTTGPMTHHHTLLASSHPDQSLGMVTSAAGTGSTQASSVLGLNQSGCSAGCKSQQQLYASHYPPMELCGHLTAPSNSAWSGLRRWLRPRNWLSAATGATHAGNKGIQHHVIGSSILSNGSVAYKSHLQNGYTTSMHRTPTLPSHLTSLPLAVPSSSNSSYVSSSAYYEEIGPGNLTKVNTSGRATHTVVEPFKQQQQQQLTSAAAGEQQQAWSYATNLDQRMANFGAEKQHHLNTDLSQLQSSSSSAVSQHSASTNVTNASSATPRHYLFTSPTAATAYKNQTLHQHQQQHQHLQACHQPVHRFMPNHMN